MKTTQCPSIAEWINKYGMSIQWVPLMGTTQLYKIVNCFVAYLWIVLGGNAFKEVIKIKTGPSGIP